MPPLNLPSALLTQAWLALLSRPGLPGLSVVAALRRERSAVLGAVARMAIAC